jgi:hypothetical protein
MGDAGIEPATSAVRGEEHTKPSSGSVRRTVPCSVRQLWTRPRDTTGVLEAENDTQTSAHPSVLPAKIGLACGGQMAAGPPALDGDRRLISLRTAGATSVPNNSMARITFSCAIVPTLICAMKR